MHFPQRNNIAVLFTLGKRIFWILAAGVCWVVFSLIFIPEYFEASGAVLVCSALVGELFVLLLPWRQDNELNKHLRSDFTEATIVSKSGTTLHLDAYTDEKSSPFHGNDVPSEIVVSTMQVKADLHGIEYKLPLHEYEPIFLLYQLATKAHTRPHKITMGTNQNPYMAGVELSGWEVRRTLHLVDVTFASIITAIAVLGTFIWGYGEWFYCFVVSKLI